MLVQLYKPISIQEMVIFRHSAKRILTLLISIVGLRDTKGAQESATLLRRARFPGIERAPDLKGKRRDLVSTQAQLVIIGITGNSG